MSKYYAVRRGRHPGIYTTWDDTKKEIHGYSGAQFKSFKTNAEARHYLKYPQAKSIEHADIYLYSDGGSRNHGNHKGDSVHPNDFAAWAYLIKTDNGEVSDSKGELGATNNRMEIMGFLNALKWLLKHHKQSQIILAVLDSRYVLNAISKHWISGWQRRHWRTFNGGPVKNADLWKDVDKLVSKFDHLHFKWVKGHANNKGNEFVDHKLNKTMDGMKDSHSISHSKKKNIPHVNQKKFNQPKITSKVSKHASNRISTDESVRNLKNNFKQLGLFKNP